LFPNTITTIWQGRWIPLHIFNCLCLHGKILSYYIVITYSFTLSHHWLLRYYLFCFALLRYYLFYLHYLGIICFTLHYLGITCFTLHYLGITRFALHTYYYVRTD
jgi:hypothetical protein